MNKLLSYNVDYDITNKIKRHILYILGIKFSFKESYDISKLGNPIFLSVAENYSAKKGIALGVIKNKKEHNKLLKILKANLDNDALKHLNRILERKDKIVKLAKAGKKFTNDKVYNKEELETIQDIKNNMSPIVEENGYFKLKNWKLPVNLFASCVFYFKHGIDTLKTFDKIGDKVILDVGTCIADSILMFRDYTKNQIIGFEPVKDVYEMALKTVELNNLQDVKIENVGLSDSEKDVEINITPEHPDWGSISWRDCEYKETIHCTTLDDYVEKNNLKVGLIKVDIEGEEPNFLKGAINTLKTQKPILLLSTYHNYHDFYKLKPWLEELNLGYKFDFFKGVDGDPVCETMLIAEVY